MATENKIWDEVLRAAGQAAEQTGEGAVEVGYDPETERVTVAKATLHLGRDEDMTPDQMLAKIRSAIEGGLKAEGFDVGQGDLDELRSMACDVAAAEADLPEDERHHLQTPSKAAARIAQLRQERDEAIGTLQMSESELHKAFLEVRTELDARRHHDDRLLDGMAKLGILTPENYRDPESVSALMSEMIIRGHRAKQLDKLASIAIRALTELTEKQDGIIRDLKKKLGE